jgi:hypothetical protein
MASAFRLAKRVRLRLRLERSELISSLALPGHSQFNSQIHVARVFRNNLVLDPRFHLDFNTAFSAPALPHGLAFK